MTIHRRMLLAGLVAPIAAAFALSTAQAQPTYDTATDPGRFAVDGYYTHYRLDTRGDDRLGMNGIGARLMWTPGALPTFGEARLPRAALGLFAEYAPEQQDRGFSMLHAGVQGDVRLTRPPVFGRVQPIASLATGVLWTDTKNPAEASSNGFPLAERSTTAFALAPALGAHVNLWGELELRADVRDVMTFNGRTLHNIQFAAGLSLPS